MHSKNIDKFGKNPQSDRRKPNYHTKCGKNYYKILSVQKQGRKVNGLRIFSLCISSLLSMRVFKARKISFPRENSSQFCNPSSGHEILLRKCIVSSLSFSRCSKSTLLSYVTEGKVLTVATGVQKTQK